MIAFLRNEQTGELHEVDRRCSIGSDPVNDVVLERRARISRRHALVYSEEGGWWIRDLQSSEGTFLGCGSRVNGVPARLDPGAWIILAKTTILRFHPGTLRSRAFDPTTGEVSFERSGTLSRLASRALAEFWRHPCVLVPHAQLDSAIWGPETPKSLENDRSQVITELRKFLGDRVRPERARGHRLVL